jgi:hypothetical protein
MIGFGVEDSIDLLISNNKSNKNIREVRDLVKVG